MKGWWKRYESKLVDECWPSINEMPIANWFEIHESGDLSFLFKKQKKVRGLWMDVLMRHWKKLINQFIARFGIGDGLLELIEKEREIALLKIRRHLEDDPSLQTYIDVALFELEKMKGMASDRADFYQLKGMLELKTGFPIDKRKTSVAEYYSLIKLIEKGNINGRG